MYLSGSLGVSRDCDQGSFSSPANPGRASLEASNSALPNFSPHSFVSSELSTWTWSRVKKDMDLHRPKRKNELLYSLYKRLLWEQAALMGFGGWLGLGDSALQ